MKRRETGCRMIPTRFLHLHCPSTQQYKLFPPVSLGELCHTSWDCTQRVAALQEQKAQQELRKVLVLQGEEFGLGENHKTVPLTIPAGYVIFPSGPAELCTTRELPAFGSVINGLNSMYSRRTVHYTLLQS